MIVLSLQWMRFQEYQGGVGDRLHLDLTQPIIAIRSNPITICISQHSHYLYFQHNTLLALTDPKSKKIRYHFENRFKDFTNMDQNIIIFVVWQPIWIVGEGLCQLCHHEVLNDELRIWMTCLLTERSLARMQSLFLCPAATGKLITFPCMVHVVSILSGMLRASVLPRGENIR